MTPGLLLLVMLFVLLAAGPARFAAPAGGPPAAAATDADDGESGAGAGGNPFGGGGDPGDAGGAAAADDPNAPVDPAALVAEAAQGMEGEQQNPPSPFGEPAAHADPSLTPPDASGAAAATLPPAEVFQRLQIPVEWLPQDPQAQALGARFLTQLYQQHWEPAAQELADTFAAQQQWHAQNEQWRQSDEFQVAAWLGQDPQRLAAFDHWYRSLAGGGTAAPANGHDGNGYALAPSHADPLAGINPDELDGTSRKIVDFARGQQAAASRQAAAYQQLTQYAQGLAAQLAELRGWAGARDEQDLHRQRQDRTVATRHAWDATLSRLNRELGFDVRGYGEQFKAACRYAYRELLGLRREHELSQPDQPFAAPDLYALLKDGLQRAGFAKVWQNRRRQAATATRAPNSRAHGAALGGPTAEDLVAAVAAGIEK